MFQLYGSDYDTPDGTCIRDYIHVVDIAEAHRMALERIDDLDSGRFNLGLARGYSNREVIVAVEKVTGLRIHVKPVCATTGRSGSACRRSFICESYLGLEAPLSRSGVHDRHRMELAPKASRGLQNMIITRTPLRISFAGGGTDLSAFYTS